jgi:hypothetical protein
MSNNTNNSIQEQVLQKIRAGAPMHSREYFIAWSALTALVALLALMASVVVVSFVAFSIGESGELFLLGFGERGLAVFVSLFPWGLLVFDILLLLLLEWLLQNFKLGYRISLLNIFIGIFMLSIVGAALVNLTPLHQTLLQRADEGTLPVFGDSYESIRESHHDQGVFRGTITSLEGNTFVIAHDDRDRDEDDGTHTVVVPPGIATEPLMVGQRVYVLGTTTANGTIEAYGVRTFSTPKP